MSAQFLPFSTLASALRWLFVALAVVAPHARAEEWKSVSSKDGVEISERAHGGSGLLEFRGVGYFEASPTVVKRVLDDVAAYPDFMPYVKEARVLSSTATGRISYQRLSPPAVSDRDYTLRVRTETRGSAEAPTYYTAWEQANELGPKEISGVVRVPRTEGSWLLEPVEGGHKTKATYIVFTDTGGSLPSFILNSAGKTGVSRVFAAVRKQAQLPKYAASRP